MFAKQKSLGCLIPLTVALVIVLATLTVAKMAASSSQTISLKQTSSIPQPPSKAAAALGAAVATTTTEEPLQSFSALIWRFWINDVVGFIKDTLFDLYDSVLSIFRSLFGDLLQEILGSEDAEFAQDLLQGPAEKDLQQADSEGKTEPPRGWFGAVFG